VGDLRSNEREKRERERERKRTTDKYEQTSVPKDQTQSEIVHFF